MISNRNNIFLWAAFLCISVLLVSCTKENVDERLSSPRMTYSLWLEASKKGDPGMEFLSRSSQKFMDMQAKNRDEFVKRMVEFSAIFEQYKVADDRIKGDKAVVILIEEKSKSTIAIPFQFEDGGWKVDLITLFSGMVAEEQNR